jgi:hypothetical protein
MEGTHINKNKEEGKEFGCRLDFYWQFLVVYFLAFIIYVLMKGTIIETTITFVFYDPIVILLFMFFLGTSVALIYQLYKKKSIFIGGDYFILRTRRKEKRYNLKQVKKISVSKDRRIRTKKPVRLIKIWTNARKKPIKIRTSQYWNEKELAHEIIRLRTNLREQLK